MITYKNSETPLPIMRGAPPAPDCRAPRADWDRPPWNRWSFQHVREILPTAEIRRGDQATAWAEAPRDISAIAFDAADGSRMTVETMLDETYTDGFLIAIGGSIVHESYHNAMTRQTPHLAQSVTKSVVSTTAGILIGQGLIDPGAPVTDYLPELAATGWAGASVSHVLDMTTGVRFIEDYDDPDSDIGRTDVACGWKPLPAGAAPGDWPGSMWDQILRLTATDAAHGERFKYRSIETDVLGLAIARVTGTRLPELISQHLWAPMGAEEHANVTVDAIGTALADGGLSATLRDFARFGQTMLNGGRADGRQVIPKSWIEDVRRGPHGLFDDAHRDRFPNGRYRNMFWIPDAAGEVHLSLGVFGQMILVDPHHDMVAVKLSSWPTFLDDTHIANTLAAIRAITAATC